MKALSNMPISFPGLFGEWEFTASPIALALGRGIYWYAILIAGGMLLALTFCMKQAPRYGLKEDDIMDGVLIGVPISIIGARLYYVIFYLDLFRDAAGKFQFSRAIAIWDGGLAIYGGVIMAFAVMMVFCRKRKIRITALSDVVVMGLLIGQCIGRWGNFFNRECFGGETTLPWRMRLWVSTTESIEVHPTFLYESLWNLVGLLLIYFLISKARRFDGENTCFYFLWYGLGRFWIEGMRTDALYFFNWTLFDRPVYVSQILSAVFVVCAAVVLYVQLHVKKHTGEDLWVDHVRRQAAEKAAETAAAEVPAETVSAPEEK